ncbi:hypothetical protein DLM76_11590 [Leptospira yasudae]|nr:hypothetical protein DLM76_11590 [Leptospira yasudae]
MVYFFILFLKNPLRISICRLWEKSIRLGETAISRYSKKWFREEPCCGFPPGLEMSVLLGIYGS